MKSKIEAIAADNVNLSLQSELSLLLASLTEKLSLGIAELVAKDSIRSKVIHLDVQMNINISQLAGGANQSLAERGGYVLDVLTGRRRVDVTGTSTSGVFYGLQSLLSLLAASSGGRTVPAVCRLCRCRRGLIKRQLEP